jgi:hypothetical protein
VHFLVFQLILADTLVSCITMPMEAIWRLTIQWYADNLTCKVPTEQQVSSRIHRSCTGVKASFKVGLKGSMTHTVLIPPPFNLTLKLALTSVQDL